MRMRWIISVLLLFQTHLYGWKMEADSIEVKSTSVSHILLRQEYDATPLIFILPDSDGSDPAAIRITNVSTTGFDAYVVEPQGSDGPHNIMDHISYIAIEPGEHTLPNGTKIVAGSISTQVYQGRRMNSNDTGWETISFNTSFSATPVVLGMIQTSNNETHGSPPAANDPKTSEPWITTVIDEVTGSDFKVALERTWTNEGNITTNETIGYLAMDANVNGNNAYFGDNSAQKIIFETIRKVDYVDGWNDNGEDVSFVNTYDNAPIVVATKNSRDGVDGGWLRSGSGNNEGSPTDHINLRVDEDLSNGNHRNHIKEDVGIVVFSEPFDTEFITSNARMIINEVMYDQTTSGTGNDEFVELYVKNAGDLKGYAIADQDCNYYRFPGCSVNQGDYVIFHTGSGTNSCSGNTKHFYGGLSPIWNNNNDDVLLIRPNSGDVTTTTNTSSCGTETFNGTPQDYIAYGRNSTGSNVDAIPSSMYNNSLSWNYDYGSELLTSSSETGMSISLTPNATDSDKAACWEKTTSGNASDNGCTNYIPTRDTESSSSLTYSMGDNNNAMPNMHITKSSIVTSDPVNGSSNPKRIPGATIRYCFTVDNDGEGDAESVAIQDSLTGDGKDNLDYVKSGFVIQDITTACNCATVSNTSGSISGTDVTITIGDLNGTNDTAHSRACAYIEATVK